jgi:hypothetical protein
MLKDNMDEKTRNDFLELVEIKMEKLSATDVKDVAEI